jgi:anti-anti-sigma factor
MKRQPTASAAGIDGRTDGRLAGRVTHQSRTAFDRYTRRTHAPGKPRLKLASSTTWTHTVIPAGELNHHSVNALETELERLCEEGVTGITVDLRELTYIDTTGVAVIAFCSGLYKRRGYEFKLIPGCEHVHRAFERAGLAGLLPFEPEEVAAHRAG